MGILKRHKYTRLLLVIDECIWKGYLFQRADEMRGLGRGLRESYDFEEHVKWT